MSDVEFTEEENTSTYIVNSPSGIIGWLINKNIVSDKEQANYVLIGLIVLVVIIIFFIFIFSSNSKDGYEQEGVPPEEFIPGLTNE